MDEQSFDPARYKTTQLQQWNAVAAGWRKWWQTYEKGAQHVSDRLVGAAEIRSGHQVLDVATGIGEPAITAARSVGPTGRVVAIDVSSEMLAIAQERARDLKLKNIAFREMDAEALDFPEDSFDAILCRWGLMFLPHLVKALRRIRQMLVPDGKFAAAVWGAAAEVPFISLGFGIAQKTFQLPPPPPGTPSLFCLAGGVLEQALSEAGFSEVCAEKLTLVFEFTSAEAFTEYNRDIGAAIAAILAKQPEEQQRAYRQALAAAVKQYATPAGLVRIPSTTICVVGRR